MRDEIAREFPEVTAAVIDAIHGANQ